MGSCRNGKFKSGKGVENMGNHKGIIISLVKHKGYGFIQEEKENKRIFFHATGVCDPKDFGDLREGLPVEYMTVETPKGTKAIGIVVV